MLRKPSTCTSLRSLAEPRLTNTPMIENMLRKPRQNRSRKFRLGTGSRRTCLRAVPLCFLFRLFLARLAAFAFWGSVGAASTFCPAASLSLLLTEVAGSSRAVSVAVPSLVATRALGGTASSCPSAMGSALASGGVKTPKSPAPLLASAGASSQMRMKGTLRRACEASEASCDRISAALSSGVSSGMVKIVESQAEPVTGLAPPSSVPLPA
jgi:hypothetical protein